MLRKPWSLERPQGPWKDCELYCCWLYFSCWEPQDMEGLKSQRLLHRTELSDLSVLCSCFINWFMEVVREAKPTQGIAKRDAHSLTPKSHIASPPTPGVFLILGDTAGDIYTLQNKGVPLCPLLISNYYPLCPLFYNLLFPFNIRKTSILVHRKPSHFLSLFCNHWMSSFVWLYYHLK